MVLPDVMFTQYLRYYYIGVFTGVLVDYIVDIFVNVVIIKCINVSHRLGTDFSRA